MRSFLVLAMLVITLLVFTLSVSAAQTVFDDKIASGENVDIDDFTFIITMNKYASSIFVDAGTMFATVPLYRCDKMEHFRICFKNTTYDEEENELYALVNITRYKPDVSLTRTANDTEVYVGQEVLVTLTVKNTADTAEKIELVDDYPPSIEIYDMEGGCQLHEGQVYWTGHLDKNEEKVCRFIIKPTEELHQSFVAHLKYWDGFKWEDEYSSTITLDAEPVLEMFSAVVREDFEVDGQTFDYEQDDMENALIGETIRLLVNITNNFDDYIDVNNLEILLPPDLKYMSAGHLRFNFINASGNRSSKVWYSDTISKISDRKLRWSGRLSEGKSKLFVLKIEARRTGEQNIIVSTDYEYDNMGFSDTDHKSIGVFDPGIVMRMTFDDESKLFSAPERLDEEDDTIDIEAFHPYRLRVYAQNKNPYSELNDVNVEVFSDLAGFKKVHYSEIAKEGQKIPYSFVLIPPSTDNSKLYKTNISIMFKNKFGELHYNSTEFSITVLPSKDLTIEWDSSEGEVLESAEETEVKVSVRNDRIVDIKNVQVTDIIPSEFHVEGVTSKKVKLLKDTDTEVYTYRFIPPRVYNKTRYNITTIVSFFDPDYRQTLNFTETRTITVEPVRPEISIDIILDEPEEIYPGTLIPVEYTIKNGEEKEIVLRLTVNFPIQEEIDLIGPKTFFIDKLDPGEEVRIIGLVKIRPKIVDTSLEWNKTIVEYYDNYGNVFYENSSEENLDVSDARINGPSIFLRTIVPEVFNKSTEEKVKILIMNKGSDAADLTISQGEMAWNTSVNADSTATIEYPVRYDSEGNYTIPEPYVKFRFQGLEAYTKGTGAEAYVKLILGPGAEQEIVQEVVVEPVVEIEPEKVEMTFAEYDELINKQFIQKVTKYGLMGIIIVIVMILIVAYIEYQRRKMPSEPIMGEEENE